MQNLEKLKADIEEYKQKANELIEAATKATNLSKRYDYYNKAKYYTNVFINLEKILIRENPTE